MQSYKKNLEFELYWAKNYVFYFSLEFCWLFII